MEHIRASVPTMGAIVGLKAEARLEACSMAVPKAGSGASLFL